METERKLEIPSNEATMRLLENFAVKHDLYGLYLIGTLGGQDLDLEVIYSYEEEPANTKYLESELSKYFEDNGYESPDIEIFSVYSERFIKGDIAIVYLSDQTPEFDLLKPEKLSVQDMKNINEAKNGPVFIFDDRGSKLVGIKLVDSSLGRVFLRPRFTPIHENQHLKERLKRFKMNYNITRRGIVDWEVLNFYKYIKEFISVKSYKKDNEDLVNINAPDYLLKRLAKYRIRLTFGELLFNMSKPFIDSLQNRLAEALPSAGKHLSVDQIVSKLLIHLYGLDKRPKDIKFLMHNYPSIPSGFTREGLQDLLYYGFLYRSKHVQAVDYHSDIIIGSPKYYEDIGNLEKVMNEYHEKMQLTYAKIAEEAKVILAERQQKQTQAVPFVNLVRV